MVLHQFAGLNLILFALLNFWHSDSTMQWSMQLIYGKCHFYKRKLIIQDNPQDLAGYRKYNSRDVCGVSVKLFAVRVYSYVLYPICV